MPQALPSTAIIVYQDDQVLAIRSDVDAVRREYEAIDVENGVYRFYNHLGRPLTASVTKPVERGTSLGLFTTVGHGEYTLVPSPIQDAAELRALVPHLAGLEDNPWFGTLEDLAAYLATVP